MTLSEDGLIVMKRRARCASCPHRIGESRCDQMEQDVGLSPAPHTYYQRLHEESAAGCPVGSWVNLLTEHGE